MLAKERDSYVIKWTEQHTLNGSAEKNSAENGNEPVQCFECSTLSVKITSNPILINVLFIIDILHCHFVNSYFL